MKEISDILGIQPEPELRNLPTSPSEFVDESSLNIDRDEIESMAEVASTAVTALNVLRVKSLGFEKEIRELSQEMNALEAQSSSLHHRLYTREHSLKLMEPLLKEYALPWRLITTICDGQMDAEWYTALERIRKPIHVAGTGTDGNDSSGPTKCMEGAQKVRKILLLRATERAKAFYVTRLRMLRRPGANAQRVQMELIQGKESVDLIREEAPKLASALTGAYKNTMKWYYTMLFGKYGRWLNRQPIMAMESPKLIGKSVNHSNGSLISMSISSSGADSLSVGARPSILHATTESLPALPMTATPPASTPHYPIEVMVRSLLVTLADAFELESKVSDVINPSSAPPQSSSSSSKVETPTSPRAPSSPKAEKQPLISPAVPPATNSRPAFVDMFDPTLNFYGEVIKNWISQCSGDFFGLLIVVRLIEKSPLQAWIKPWLNVLSKACWTHILKICELQSESIEHVALMASTIAQNKQASQGPHILTQLVSTYLSGTLQLCGEHPEPSLSSAVKGIVEAYELFISKLANGNEKVFFNNYFVMSALLSDIDGPLANDLASHFQLLVSVYSGGAKSK